MTARLEIRDVHQSFGAVVAVEALSLTVEPGEIVCLLGQSGCGKTTLLRVVAGLESPDRGSVLLGGRALVGPGLFLPPEQRGVGMVFQDYALFPHLTILENIRFGLSRLDPAKAQATALQALERVGLAHAANDYPHTLSGGQQQRVALARALAPRPGLLLMDEPFSNLDQRLRERVRGQTMELLRENGATGLVVTHDPVEAMLIADRIALMQQGRLVQMGAPEDLYERPGTLFAARYFCDLNEIPGVVRSARASTALGDFDAPGLTDGPCVVCIRPQALSFGAQGREAVTINRRFIGEAQLIACAVEGLAAPLEARLPPGGAPVAGGSVRLSVAASGVLVFPAPGRG